MQARFKLAPIVRMFSVIVVVASVIVLIYAILRSLPNFDALMIDSSWVFADLVHIPQFLIPFVIIYWISRGRLEEYGFNLRQRPPVFTHGRMLGLGALFGLLMSVKFIPSIVRNMPVVVPQPVTFVNVLGNMTFQWIVVGVSEETMFRGLIQTYLMNNLKGYIRIFGHDLHVGTIIGAILWGVFHFINILVMPLESVVLVVALTTVAGLFMGYAYQETGSLLTTIIVHNTIFSVPLTLGYVLYWLS